MEKTLFVYFSETINRISCPLITVKICVNIILVGKRLGPLVKLSGTKIAVFTVLLFMAIAPGKFYRHKMSTNYRQIFNDIHRRFLCYNSK